MIIAGIDEAGYGPLLGPLLVSCSAIEIPTAVAAVPRDLKELPCCWKLLKSAVIKKHGPAAKGRMLIADSKVVHHLTDGVKLLEQGVLAFLRAAEASASDDAFSLQLCLECLGCADHGMEEHPWYAPGATPLPYYTDGPTLSISANMLKNALVKSGISVVALRTLLVPESRFNQLVMGTRNKASALISLTLRHLYYLHTTFGERGLVVGIDKQGGRDYYTQLLLQSFPDATLTVLQEDGTGSSYVLTETHPIARQTVLHFREKGETHFLPVALASMICKYLRELCMENFNTWFCRQIPNLKPTAGYYLDGARWLVDVTPHLERLNLRREELVRIR